MPLINCTPHDITIRAADGAPLYTIPASGHVARAAESVARVGTIVGLTPIEIPLTESTFGHLVMSIPSPDEAPADRMDVGFPPENLSTGEATYYIVSLLCVQAARAQGRPVSDLLTPGMVVRDGHGRIVGCQSLMTHR